MTLKDLYDWLAPQFDGPVRLGSLDGQAERFFGPLRRGWRGARPRTHLPGRGGAHPLGTS